MSTPIIDELADILSIKRPYDGEGEQLFIERYLLDLPGAWTDGHNNVHVIVGSQPDILFSAHTDTVHRQSGLQKIYHDPFMNMMFTDETETCLGADNGAGCWVLIQMIRNEVPGYYIFHRGEEKGCIGSHWVTQAMGENFSEFRAAIAFDRKDTDDIITHQMGMRTASDSFAYQLAELLGMNHRPDPTGSFTDTESYADIISECTNVSVGYSDEHTPNEALDIAYVTALARKLITLDWNLLKAERNPGPHISARDFPVAYSYKDQLTRAEAEALVHNCPDAAVTMLLAFAADWSDVEGLEAYYPNLTEEIYFGADYGEVDDDETYPQLVIPQVS